MSRLWNKIINVVLVFLKMTSFIQCYCKTGTPPYSSVYYAQLGKDFVLDVKTYHLNHTWRKDGKQLLTGTCNDYSSTSRNARIYSCVGDPDLHFKQTKLQDNGKYILEIFCPDRKVYSFELIVQTEFFIYIDCVDMTVYEGDNITCICKATDNRSSPKWNQPGKTNSEMGVSTDILTLRNLSKIQSGTYTCFAKSRNFVNNASFNLKVVPRNSTHTRVEMQYFKAFCEAGVGYGKLVLICKAEGIPEPRYTISFNGIAVNHGNMYNIDTRNKSSLGQYECFAINRLNSVRRFLFLNESFLVNSCMDKEKEKVIYKIEMEWKIGLMIGAFSFLAGILFVCILTCSLKKFGQKDVRYENSDHVDNPPRSAQGELEPASENEEMRLRHTPGRSGNEEVRHHQEYDLPVVGNRGDHDYYNDNSYQELSRDRETDKERYHPLLKPSVFAQDNPENIG